VVIEDVAVLIVLVRFFFSFFGTFFQVPVPR